MENKLKSLFEYQKFENNSRLAKLIRETESRYGTELSEDELSMISAAGDMDSMQNISGVATEEIEKIIQENDSR